MTGLRCSSDAQQWMMNGIALSGIVVVIIVVVIVFTIE